MEFKKSRLQVLKDLINKQKTAAISPQARTITNDVVIRSPPSPIVSQDIGHSISPVRSPLRVMTKPVNLSSPPSTPPTTKPDINDIDSPNSSQPSKLAKKRKLAEELKRALNNYKATVRNWESATDKNASRILHLTHLGDGSGIDIIIQKCFSLGSHGRSKVGGLNFGQILALCNEVVIKASVPPNAEKYELIQSPKWICFNPTVPTEIGEGTMVKLYPPWQKIFSPAIGEEVIYCTDFYKVLIATDVPRSLKVQSLRTNTVADETVARMFSGEYESSWRGLLPYAYTNNNTLTKQTFGYQRLISLDAVMCEMWRNSSDNSSLLLVKDSDNLLALVEDPDGQFKTDYWKPGTFCRLRSLYVVDRITTVRALPLFSVISLFNRDQPKVDKFYYVCRVEGDAKVEFVPALEIPLDGPHILKVPTSHLSQCPQNRDCRFLVEGTLTKKSKSSTDVILNDDSGTIDIRVLPSFEWEQLIFEEQVTLIYLRVFRGVCTLDQFSIIKTTTES